MIDKKLLAMRYLAQYPDAPIADITRALYPGSGLQAGGAVSRLLSRLQDLGLVEAAPYRVSFWLTEQGYATLGKEPGGGKEHE